MEYKGVPPFNASNVLKLNDTLPPGLDADDIALGGVECQISSEAPSDIFSKGLSLIMVLHIVS